MEGAVRSEVAAILRKARVIDSRIPVAALPASNSGAECAGEIVIISKRNQ